MIFQEQKFANLAKSKLQTDVHKEAESLGPDAYMVATSLRLWHTSLIFDFLSPGWRQGTYIKACWDHVRQACKLHSTLLGMANFSGNIKVSQATLSGTCHLGN